MLVPVARPVPAAPPTAPLLPGQSPLSLQESMPPAPQLQQEPHLPRLRRRCWPPHPLPLRPRWPQPEPHTPPATVARSDNQSASSTEQHKQDKDSTTRHRIPTMALLPNPMLQCPNKPALPKDASPIHKILDGTKPQGNTRNTYVRPSHSRDRAQPGSGRGHRKFANNM